MGRISIAARLAQPRPAGVVGLNLGANKSSADRSADFAEVLTLAGAFVDFATVNVSSPNTERLRELQGPAALDALLAGVMSAKAALARPIPVFLKIAPDLGAAELAELVGVAVARGIDGLIATNTTLSREGLASRYRAEAGGLSGRRLFDRSTRVLARVARLAGGRVPLIGVGGVSSAEGAYAKIRAGAHAVQLYTGLVYGGLGLVREIALGLDQCRSGTASEASPMPSDGTSSRRAENDSRAAPQYTVNLLISFSNFTVSLGASRPNPTGIVRIRSSGHADIALAIGSVVMARPVAARMAFATAGPIGGTPGSPTPVGRSVEATIWTSTSGIASIRSGV